MDAEPIVTKRVLGIAGFKNSGKTTLLVRLVEELTRRGYRLATVKHAHHSFDIDHAGRDSYRHREAGAREVAVVSRYRWALMHELGGLEADEPSLQEVVGKLGPCDLVLVEGYKRDRHPKIEVRDVKAAGWQGNQWLVEEGLRQGDRVVVDGMQRLTPGAQVQPVAVASAGTPAAPSTVPSPAADRPPPAMKPETAPSSKPDAATPTVKEDGAVTEEELFRWCIDQLPYFALPRYIEFRAELPRSPVGRVLKRTLRDEGVTESTWDADAAGISYEKR